MDSTINDGVLLSSLFIIGYFIKEKMEIKNPIGLYLGGFLMSISFLLAILGFAGIIARMLQ